MAPSIAANRAPPKSTKGAKPSSTRPVIPVLPLPYMNKKKSKISSATTATSPQEPVSSEASAEQNHKPATLTPAPSPPPVPENGAYSGSDGKLSKDSEAENEVNTYSQARESTATSPVRESSDEAFTEQTGDFDSNHLNSAVEPVKMSLVANGHGPQLSSTAMPPPLPQATRDIIQQHDDSSSFSSNDVPRQSPMHHAHPGMRNLRIGTTTYAESQGSSPLHSGSGVQQQHPEVAAHTNGHSHGYSNGFSPMEPRPPPGFFQPQDQYARRQMTQLTSPDSYTPSGTPGKPDHPFPSYPSSVQNDFEGNGQPFYGHFPAPMNPGAPTSTNGHSEDVHAIPPTHPRANGSHVNPQAIANGNVLPHRPIPPQFPMPDHLDGLLEYIYSQFDNAAFADYLLELNYSDCRAPPIRISGHNLLFARSPALNNLMATTTGQLCIDGSKRLLRLETDDRFVTSEGFHMAVSRLYGGPLLDESGLAPQRSPKLSAMHVERFNLALGYAAAGHILHISPVVDRGIVVASHLIGWNTVEKALDFATDGGLDSHWTFEPHGYPRSTYGRMVNHLIPTALDFLIGNFPVNFHLDTSVPDFTHNCRLPVTTMPEVQSVRPAKHPLIANPRLSSIKFGDVTFSHEESGETSPTFVLSKLLLSLPFHLVKFLLEHPRLVAATSATVHQQLIQTVVAEREKRRLMAFNAPIPNAKRIEDRNRWESVGWKENIAVSSSLDSPEVPILTRTWVGFTFPDN